MLNELNRSDVLPTNGVSATAQNRAPRIESPLIGLRYSARDVWAASAIDRFTLNERPFLDMVTLRGNPTDPAFSAAIRSEIGCEVPLKPNTVLEGRTYRLLWLGPDEWLAQSKAPQQATIESRLLSGLAGSFASAVEVSSGYTTLAISGPNAVEILARGCPLDLHPSVLGSGQCAQSYFFKAPILLVGTGADEFDIVVRRSFAEYVVMMVLDAGGSTFP